MVDAIASIRLYRDNDADIVAGNVPKHNGIGVLTDITDALVTEERQGAFLFTFSYAKPDESRSDYWVQNMVFSGLKKNNVVKAKANEYDGEQLFRIDEVTLDAVTGNKEVNCVAIAQYDLALNTIIKAESKSNSLFAAMDMLLKNAVVPHKFKAWSDVSGVNTYLAERKNVLNAIAGSEGSIIDTWRADLQYDNFTVKAHANRGINRGVQIAYTKNLTGLTETTSGQIYTRIVPFATVSVKDVLGNTDEEVITLKERYIDAPNVKDYPQPMSTSVDFSDKLNDVDRPDEAALRKVAKEYFTETKCNLPSVAYEFSFVDLSKTEDYADYALLERISLFDIVTIRHNTYGIDIATDVIKYEYDPLNEWYERIYLGSERYSLDNQALDDKRENEAIKDKVNGIPNYLNNAINDATIAITGNDGGNVVFYPPRQPQEIFIMDTDNVDTAKQVLRMNKSGIGFSANGLNGPYGTAWTLDGKFAADYIATGTLDASKVKVFGGSSTSYTSIDGNIIESRGQFTRKFRGNTTTHDIRLKMENGYFRAHNQSEGRSLYFSDFGISTYADGSGGSNSSGTIAFFNRDYGEGNGILMHSYKGVLALRSDENRIVIDSNASVTISSNEAPVWIRPGSGGIDNVNNTFAFTSADSNNDAYIMYGRAGTGVTSAYRSGLRYSRNSATVSVVDKDFSTGGDTVIEAGTAQVNEVTKRNGSRSVYWNGSGSGTTSGSGSNRFNTLYSTAMRTNDSWLYLATDGGGSVAVTDVKGFNAGNGITYRPIVAAAFREGSSLLTKQNIEPFDGKALALINKVDVMQYNLNSDVDEGIYDKKRYGIIAELNPEFSDDNGLTIDKSKLDMAHLKATQELSAFTLEALSELYERLEILEMEAG